MKKLVLIDGNAIMHRAYHALPPLSKDGQQVNAVYGFTTMLLRVMEDLRPTHLAIAFDRPEKTFRKELLDSYQSQRPEMDDELSSQFPIVREVMTAMHVPIYEKAGYEADDVIGTIARKVTSDKLQVTNNEDSIDEVIIVTGDRDLLQLVDEKTRLYMPIVGLSNAKLYNQAAVVEKFGLAPEQIIDYKALIGDASDNYHGVAGIGPKTAVNLLTQYKTLNNLYDHLEDIANEKLRAKLLSGKESAFLSQKLATIVCDVEIEFHLDAMGMFDPKSEEVLQLFETYRFNSLLKRVKGEVTEEPKVAKESKKSEESKDKKKEDDQQMSLLDS